MPLDLQVRRWSCPGASVIKLFTAVSYEFSYLARVHVPGKPFQPGLILVSKAGAYPSEAPLGAPL